MTLLSACATAGSDHSACPPVVDYPAAVQKRAAIEIKAMPQESVVVGMMADYHVMRQQVRGCRGAEIDSKSGSLDEGGRSLRSPQTSAMSSLVDLNTRNMAGPHRPNGAG